MSIGTRFAKAALSALRPLRAVPAALLPVILSLSGCGTTAPGNGMLDKALDLVGLQAKPPAPPPASAEELPDLRKLPKRVTLRIHAGELLNTDASGRSLSLVVKIVRLKETEALLQAPYAAFKDAAGDKAAPMQGVVESREIVLTPGQKYEVVEWVPGEIGYLAVVALFRSPDPLRWRFAFDVREPGRSGITLGAHGCALSVAEGKAVDAPAESLRLAGVNCR